VTRTQRYVNLIAVVVPFLGFIAALVLLWNEAVGWVDLAILAGMYVLTAGGVTIGFHRLLTHRAFATYKPMEYALAALGSMAVQGPVIDWVADHRRHHAHADADGDPHSPHVGHGSGLRGLWHAHVGWLLEECGVSDRRRHAPDLMEDRGMRTLSAGFLWLVALSITIPFGIGWLASGTIAGALTAALWGGAVRIFFVHHATWSINHHAFPRSAFHGLRWWEIDPSGIAIRVMRRLGLAWNVVEITPERQRERLA
jgi:stearoyl-CoA desaturase (delta-9 desaturase)